MHQGSAKVLNEIDLDQVWKMITFELLQLLEWTWWTWLSAASFLFNESWTLTLLPLIQLPSPSSRCSGRRRRPSTAARRSASGARTRFRRLERSSRRWSGSRSRCRQGRRSKIRCWKDLAQSDVTLTFLFSTSAFERKIGCYESEKNILLGEKCSRLTSGYSNAINSCSRSINFPKPFAFLWPVLCPGQQS